MSVSFDTLKPGERLYDCHRHRMGSTTMQVMGVWYVQVIEVNPSKREALISWNMNPEKWVGESYFRQPAIRRFPPEWSRRGIGEGSTCYVCKAKEHEGHLPTCTHPKAKRSKVTKRKES